MSQHDKRDRFLQAVAKGPQVMGILNVTPDSFSDGARYDSVEPALNHALQMQAEGAAIIDIGAESTRPGATPVAQADELARLQPVLEAVCPALDVAVSVDTYKPGVARRAMALGTSVINDVRGLQGDPEMAPVVAETGAAVVIMHALAADDPERDMLTDVQRFFERSLKIAAAAGIPEQHIILDPGIGFGKTVPQNYQLLAHLGALKAFGLPLLLGLSRKRMIGELLNVEMQARLNGTLSANVLGLAHGARVLRVHDVLPHVEAIKVFNATEAAK